MGVAIFVGALMKFLSLVRNLEREFGGNKSNVFNTKGVLFNLKIRFVTISIILSAGICISNNSTIREDLNIRHYMYIVPVTFENDSKMHMNHNEKLRTYMYVTGVKVGYSNIRF